MDIKIDKTNKFTDNRGDLVVFLTKNELNAKDSQFGQIYFVTFKNKGEIRGNHYHNDLREWFGIVAGKLELVLKDVDSGEQKTYILDAEDEEYKRLEIGPRVAHSFKSLTDFAALLNYTNKLWSPDDVHEEKLI